MPREETHREDRQVKRGVTQPRAAAQSRSPEPGNAFPGSRKPEEEALLEPMQGTQPCRHLDFDTVKQSREPAESGCAWLCQASDLQNGEMMHLCVFKSEEELKSLLMKVKVESEKVG